MAASDLTQVAFIYKRLYTDRQVGDLAMRAHPLYKMMSKEGGFTGSAFFYPIRYGNPQGISGTFSALVSGGQVAGGRSSKGVQLQASRKKKYGLITMDGEAMAAADGDRGAFLTLVTQETDGIIEEFGDRLAYDAYRDGSGVRGKVASVVDNGATLTVTLTVPDDARNFKVDMEVVLDDAADGLSPKANSATVLSVDEDGGKITIDDTATPAAANDFIFAVGDPGTCMEGLSKHLPLTAPVLGSDSFRGIDRGVDPRRLAGVRVDDTATSIEENAGLVAVKISQVGKKANVVMLNPIKFWEVARRRDAKVTYDGGGVKAAIGFEGFDLHTPAGTLRVVSDPDCPTNLGYDLNLSTVYLKHLKGLPHIITDDGRPSLRMAAEDSIEARVRCWVNMVFTEPGANGVFSI